MPAIDVQKNSKSFGSLRVVGLLRLIVQPNEIMAFLGLNEACKTTTIHSFYWWIHCCQKGI